jgi:hypothetical protein
MAASTTLLQFLLMAVAGWLQRQQAATIDYLKAENRMLRARLGGRRIVFTDAERRQLAEKARALGRKAGVTFALPSSTASWRSSSTCKPGETAFSQKKKRSAQVLTSSLVCAASSAGSTLVAAGFAGALVAGASAAIETAGTIAKSINTNRIC